MSTDNVVEDCKGLDTLAFKLRLASIIEYIFVLKQIAQNLVSFSERLRPIRETYHQLMLDESTLWGVLENGGKRARQIVSKTLEDIKTILGFL